MTGHLTGPEVSASCFMHADSQRSECRGQIFRGCDVSDKIICRIISAA